MSSADRKNGVPTTVTSIPLVDPHAPKPDPSIGDLVKDATAQVSTLVRAEVELARAEITRDVKKGLTGSVFFILGAGGAVLLDVLFLLLRRRAARHVAVAVGRVPDRVRHHGRRHGVLALFGYLKVRRIRGPQKTIETVRGDSRRADAGPRRRPRRCAPPTARPRPTRPRIRLAGNGYGAALAATSAGHPIRRSSASTVRGAISRCTPTAFGSMSWKPTPRPTNQRTR